MFTGIITNLGKLYHEKGDLTKAAELYKRAIETPDGGFFAGPYYNLGNLYRDTGRIDEAIEQYQKVIEIDPNFPFAYQNLAVIYINNKQDLVKVAKVLEQLKKIQPNNARIYYNLGLVYLATGNNELAIENLEIGLSIAKEGDSEVERVITEILSKIK